MSEGIEIRSGGQCWRRVVRASDQFLGGQGVSTMQHLSSFQSAPTLGLKAVWSWSYFKTTRDKVVDIFSQATGCPSSAAFELFEGSLQLRETDSCHHHHQQTSSGHEYSNPTKLKTQTHGPSACKPGGVKHTEPDLGRTGGHLPAGSTGFRQLRAAHQSNTGA